MDCESLDLLSERVIGAFFQVSNALGAGFLEKVYENALVHELRKQGLAAVQQKSIPVYYDGVLVGDYVADLIVEGKVLLELKAVKALSDEHSAVCMNYLRATKLPVCLLLNFATPRLGIKRLVSDSYANEANPI